MDSSSAEFINSGIFSTLLKRGKLPKPTQSVTPNLTNPIFFPAMRKLNAQAESRQAGEHAKITNLCKHAARDLQGPDSAKTMTESKMAIILDMPLRRPEFMVY